jgi:hypothetical protein
LIFSEFEISTVILVESTASTKHTQQLCELPVNCISSATINEIK